MATNIEGQSIGPEMNEIKKMMGDLIETSKDVVKSNDEIKAQTVSMYNKDSLRKMESFYDKLDERIEASAKKVRELNEVQDMKTLEQNVRKSFAKISKSFMEHRFLGKDFDKKLAGEFNAAINAFVGSGGSLLDVKLIDIFKDSKNKDNSILVGWKTRVQDLRNNANKTQAQVRELLNLENMIRIIESETTTLGDRTIGLLNFRAPLEEIDKIETKFKSFANSMRAVRDKDDPIFQGLEKDIKKVNDCEKAIDSLFRAYEKTPSRFNADELTTALNNYKEANDALNNAYINKRDNRTGNDNLERLNETSERITENISALDAALANLTEQEQSGVLKFLSKLQGQMGENYNEITALTTALKLLSDIKLGNIEELMGRFHSGNPASNSMLETLTGLPVNNQKARDAALRSLNPNEYDRLIKEASEQEQAALEREKRAFDDKWKEFASAMMGENIFANIDKRQKGRVIAGFEKLGKELGTDGAKATLDKLNEEFKSGKLFDKHLKGSSKFVNDYLDSLTQQFPKDSLYTKMSNYDVFEKGMNLTKVDKFYEQLAQREIDMANKMTDPTLKKFYTNMANQTFTTFRGGAKDYQIEEKLSSTVDLINNLKSQLDTTKDPKMISVLEEQLDEAYIKFVALEEISKNFSNNFSRMKQWGDVFSIGTDDIEKYYRKYREDFSIGNNHFSIPGESADYWNRITAGITTEKQLADAIESRKGKMVELAEEIEVLEGKERELGEVKDSLPYGKEKNTAWDVYQKAADNTNKLVEEYNELRQELFNLIQLQENWGHSLQDMPVINDVFLDSEWREEEKAFYAIDDAINAVVADRKKLQDGLSKEKDKQSIEGQSEAVAKNTEEEKENRQAHEANKSTIQEETNAEEKSTEKKDELSSASVENTAQTRVEEQAHRANADAIAEENTARSNTPPSKGGNGEAPFAGGGGGDVPPINREEAIRNELAAQSARLGKDVTLHIKEAYNANDELVQILMTVKRQIEEDNKILDQIEHFNIKFDSEENVAYTSRMTDTDYQRRSAEIELENSLKEQEKAEKQVAISVEKAYKEKEKQIRVQEKANKTVTKEVEDMEKFEKSIMMASEKMNTLEASLKDQGLYVGETRKNFDALSSSLSEVTNKHELDLWNKDLSVFNEKLKQTKIAVNAQKTESKTPVDTYDNTIPNRLVREEVNAQKRINKLVEERINNTDKIKDAQIKLLDYDQEDEQHWAKIAKLQEEISRLKSRNKNIEHEIIGSEAYNASIANRFKDADKKTLADVRFASDAKALAQESKEIKDSNAALEQYNKNLERSYKLRVSNLNQDDSSVKYINNVRSIEAIENANYELFAKFPAVQEEMLANQRAYNSLLEEMRHNLRQADLESVFADQISAYKKAEETLKSYEARLQSIINMRRNSDNTSAAIEQIGAVRGLLNDDTFKEYGYSIDQLNEKMEELAQSVGKVFQAEKTLDSKSFDESISKSLNKIDKFVAANSAMGKEFEQRFKNLRVEIDTDESRQQSSMLMSEFYKLQSEVIQAGKTGRSVFDNLSQRIKQMSTNFVAMYFSFYDIYLAGQRIFETVRELDTQLIDLRKTTSMTSDELNEFYYASSDIAKQMGVTTASIIEQASSWSRLGYNTKEASEQMAQLSSQFATISPGMTTEKSQEGLVSIMKAWDIGVEDVKREIMDNINTLGNRFAESNQDIVEGMERSAAALAATGTTYQEAFALFTGAEEVVQQPEVVGRALRSISMRVRGYSEDSGDGMMELDESLKNITGDLIDLTKTAEHTQGVSIFKDGSTTEFKSLVEYFGEIHDIWDEMSQKQQNDFLQQAFGKTQAQAGASIIQNYEAVTRAMEEMENAAGSSDREMSITRDSIDFKLNAIKQEWVSTFQVLADKEVLKGALDVLLEISDVLGTILEHPLLSFGGVVAGTGLLSQIGLAPKWLANIRDYGEKLNSLKETYDTVTGIIGEFTEATQLSDSVIKAVQGATEGLTVAEQAEMLAKAGLTQAQMESIMGNEGEAAAAIKTALANQTAAGAEGARTVTLRGLSVALKSAAVSAKAFLLTNPLGWLMMAGAAIGVAVAALDKFTTTAEEAGEAFDKTSQELDETTGEIKNLDSEIGSMKDTIDGLNPITDQDQISDLETELGILEKRRQVLERTAELQGKKKAKDAYEEVTSGQGWFGLGQSYIDEAEDLIKNRNIAKAERDRLAEQLNSPDTSPEEYEYIVKQIDDADEFIDKTDLRIGEIMEELEPARDAMEATGEETYKNTISRIDGIESRFLSFGNNATNEVKKVGEAAEDELSEVQNLANSISALATHAGQLDLASDIYNDVKDGGTFDFNKLTDEGTENNPKFRDIFGVYEDEYNELLKVIMESPQDIKKTQQAWDDLITAWVYGSGELKNVTEDTRLAAIQSLEQQGIQNAKEIVDNYLKEVNAVEKYNKALKDLVPTYAENYKALRKYKLEIAANRFESKDVKAYRKELNSLKKTLSVVMGQELSVYDAETFSKDANNLKDLEKALDGDVDALHRVKAAMVDQQLAKISPELDTTQFNDDVIALQEWMATHDLGTMEGRAEFETQPFVQSCMDMIRTGQATAAQIQSIFDALDIDATVTYETVEVPSVISKSQAESGKYQSVTGVGYIDTETGKVQTTTIKVPSIKYGSKTKAHVDSYKPIDTSSSKGSGGSGGGGGGSDDKEAKKEKDRFKETYDWIEKRISHLQRAIDKFGKVASGVWRDWTERGKALNKEINTSRKLIEANEKAAKRYNKQANALLKTADSKTEGKKALNSKLKEDKDGYVTRVKLKKGQNYYIDEEGRKQALTSKQTKEIERLQKLFKSGKIGKGDIEDITDQAVYNFMTMWEELWQAGLDATSAAVDAQDQLAQEYQEKFDNLVHKYDEKLAKLEYRSNLLSEHVSQFEALGLEATQTHISHNMDLTQSRKDKLASEIKALQRERDRQLASGDIEKGSEQWEGYQQKIRDTKLELEKCNTELAQLNKQSRDLANQRFDYMLESINKIADESQFIIDTLSHKQLFKQVSQFTSNQLKNDHSLFAGMGQLTDEGMTTLGQLGIQYNVYSEELVELNKKRNELVDEIAKEPWRKDLADELDELDAKTRQTSLSMQGSIQGIIDLIKQGVQEEVNGLKTLTDLYKNSLDSQKTLYDYNKQIKDQTTDITSLQKQLSAFRGDNSVENQSRLQTLNKQLIDAQKKLQETETDHLISEQKKMLDNLVVEYSDILNAKFNDTDQVLIDAVSYINEHADIIGKTTVAASEGAGVAVTDKMDAVLNTWSDPNSALVAIYGAKDYNSNFNTVNAKLDSAGASLSTLADLGNEQTGVRRGIDNVEAAIRNRVTYSETLASITAKLDSVKDAIEALDLTVNLGDYQNNGGSSGNRNIHEILGLIDAHYTAKDYTKVADLMKELYSTYGDPGLDSNDNSYWWNTDDGIGKRNYGYFSQILRELENMGLFSVNDTTNYTSYNRDETPSAPISYGEQTYKGKTKNEWHDRLRDREDRRDELVGIINDSSESKGHRHKAKKNLQKVIKQITEAEQALAWFDKHNYAKGTHNLPKNEFAWTQEQGMEAIIRKSDGAVLTPLKRGDSVLTAAQTENLFQIAKIPISDLKSNLTKPGQPAAISTTNLSTTIGDISLNVSLPNAMDYSSFKEQLKADRSMDKYLKSITVDPIFGSSRMKKFNS